jgi:hypothetical protein
MGNKIRKVIESEIQEIVLKRLSSINLGASTEVSKLVKTSAKEIAKKFYKALNKVEEKKIKNKSGEDAVKSKKVVQAPKVKRSVKKVVTKKSTASKAKVRPKTKAKK